MKHRHWSDFGKPPPLLLTVAYAAGLALFAYSSRPLRNESLVIVVAGALLGLFSVWVTVRHFGRRRTEGDSQQGCSTVSSEGAPSEES